MRELFERVARLVSDVRTVELPGPDCQATFCEDSGHRSIGKEDKMALARVVSFEGVTKDRIDELKRELESGERSRDDVPATETFVLYDADTGKSLAILLFETEEEYRRGDEILDAMPTDETPGRRVSVEKYEVSVHATR